MSRDSRRFRAAILPYFREEYHPQIQVEITTNRFRLGTTGLDVLIGFNITTLAGSCGTKFISQYAMNTERLNIMLDSRRTTKSLLERIFSEFYKPMEDIWSLKRATGQFLMSNNEIKAPEFAADVRKIANKIQESYNPNSKRKVTIYVIDLGICKKRIESKKKHYKQSRRKAVVA